MNASEYSISAAKKAVNYTLVLQHEVFIKSLDGRLFSAPIAKPLGRVLDIGTGSGIWAAEVAAEHPAAEVIGIDSYPQPQIAAPSNCRFIVMDAEKEKDWEKIGDGATFDLMHTRLVPFHIKEVPGVLRRCYEHLRPGGYIEMHEVWPPLRTDEPPGAPEHASKLISWTKLRVEGAAKIGIDQNLAGLLPGLLSKAGFVDVQVQELKFPVGPWMEDEKMKDVGRTWLKLLQIVHGKTVTPGDLLTHLGMEIPEITKIVEEANKELGVGKIYTKAMFIWARKPEGVIDRICRSFC
ncbi:sam dependent methyltransferase [Xylogone sp. PMI_703]|nr:sam dependent methyltransferase [Xylogone sp. PMI_703]